MEGWDDCGDQAPTVPNSAPHLLTRDNRYNNWQCGAQQLGTGAHIPSSDHWGSRMIKGAFLELIPSALIALLC